MRSQATTNEPRDRAREAARRMLGFAERTGLLSGQAPTRYLWTDAFAVCNFLGISRALNDPRFMELALRLIDQVHHTLGKHRLDDSRAGWISGLAESEGERRPTSGGLRIGKELPERGPLEPFDEWLEWDRDGQYFHYLTKWMQALDQTARATQQPRFNRWAVELARAAFIGFSYPRGRPIRLAWKMNIDLSRPLVASMGQHDPLDGLLTCHQLASTATQLGGIGDPFRLRPEIEALSSIAQGQHWTTADPLGIGGLLADAYRVDQLRREGAALELDLMDALMRSALEGLAQHHWKEELRAPPSERLPFRELGLAIGLRAAEALEVDWRQALQPHVGLASTLEAFWSAVDPEASAWKEHREINEVMLATSLLPEGFLQLQPLR